MFRTMSSMCSSTPSGGRITTSTPSPSTVSCESVTRAATSISASAVRSSPVISQSIHTMRSCERSLFSVATAGTLRRAVVVPLAVNRFGPYAANLNP